jgi:hypothetical protein
MGAKISQKVLGLEVKMLNGGRITFDKALIRDMSKIYPLLLLIDWLIGIATPDPDQRQNILTVSQTQQLFKCRRLLLRDVDDTASSQ